LCNNSTNDDINIKLASLTTLGYICEELYPEDLTDSLKNNIILALTNNISKEGSIEPTRLSVKALLYSIPYISPNFKVDHERDFIMQKVFIACEVEDEEVQEYGLHCLREISIQEYDSVHFFFQRICEVTGNSTKSSSSRVGAQAFEYWTSMAEEETDRLKSGSCKNYIESCKDQLL
jgi:importin subunit beta-1